MSKWIVSDKYNTKYLKKFLKCFNIQKSLKNIINKEILPRKNSLIFAATCDSQLFPFHTAPLTNVSIRFSCTQIINFGKIFTIFGQCISGLCVRSWDKFGAEVKLYGNTRLFNCWVFLISIYFFFLIVRNEEFSECFCNFLEVDFVMGFVNGGNFFLEKILNFKHLNYHINMIN